VGSVAFEATTEFDPRSDVSHVAAICVGFQFDVAGLAERGRYRGVRVERGFTRARRAEAINEGYASDTDTRCDGARATDG